MRWLPLPLDEVGSIHIQRVLEMCRGNRVRAAQTLGIGRTSLYRFLKTQRPAGRRCRIRRRSRRIRRRFVSRATPAPVLSGFERRAFSPPAFAFAFDLSSRAVAV